MPGDLVEIDTTRLFNPITKQKRYIYTVIDLYTRMAYARVYEELRPINALNTIQKAWHGNYYPESEPLKKMNDKVLTYIDYYNYRRVHLGISYRTPAEMLHRLWKLYGIT